MSDYQAMLDSKTESKNNDTKSSAGDKFETGRAMMQAEQDKVSTQIDIASAQLSVLDTINLEKEPEIIGLGSLVLCKTMRYYISISFGKVMIDDQKYYGISLESPIGQLLLGKSVGETISFNDKSIKIIDVY